MAFTTLTSFLRYSREGRLIGTGSLTFTFEKEGNNWVGVCLELGTSAYDSDLDEATKQLNEAVSLQLNELERLGFVDEFLAERNVRVQPVRQQDDSNQGFIVAGAESR